MPANRKTPADRRRQRQPITSGTIPEKRVDPEVVRQVIDLVIELNKDTLRELAKH